MSFVLEKYPPERREAAATTTSPAVEANSPQSPEQGVFPAVTAEQTQRLEDWAKAVVGRDWEILWEDEESVQEGSEEEKTGPQTEASSDTTGPVVASHDPSGAASKSEPVTGAEEEGLPVPSSHNGSAMDTETSPTKLKSADTGAVNEDDAMDVAPVSSSAEDAEPMQEDEEDESSVVQHQDGWYMGRIHDYHGLDVATGRPLFTVYYVGEEEEPYQVALSPEHVRPNCQRWILRTVALLLRTESPTDNSNTNPLPPDTRLPRDAPALRGIAEEASSLRLPPIDLPTTTTTQGNNDSATDSPNLLNQSTFSEQTVNAVIECRHLAAQQIYLRTQLGPVEEDEDEADTEYAYPYTGQKPPAQPSEAYVDHLNQLLRNVVAACDWILAVYRDLLMPIYGGTTVVDTNRAASVSSSLPTVLTKETLLSRGLGQGQAHLHTLSQMDPTGRPKKRKAASVGVENKLMVTTSRRVQNRHKRQRMDALFQKQSDGSSTMMNSNTAFELEPQDLWGSTKVVQQYIRRMLVAAGGLQAPPWCLQMVGKMMETLSVHLIDRYRAWQENAEVFLGRREAPSVLDSAEHSAVEDGDSESDDKGDERFFVSYSMIISAIDAAQHDPILSHFDFSALVAELRHKLKAVDDFEHKCWQDIERVLEDAGCVPTDPETDPIVVKLRHHLRVSNEPQSIVENVHPLGRDLTREVIENAIVYRLWFLDLVYAEVTRERSAFVEKVVNQLSRLPPLQSPVVRSPKAASMDLSLTLDATAPRVQALSQKVLDHVIKSNRYRAALNDRQGVGISWHELEAKLQVDIALSDLSKAPVLSVAEELVFCRKDVLRWLEAAENLFAQGRPPFRLLKKNYEELEMLRNGQSATRYANVKSLKQIPEVDAEICAFVLADLEPFKDSFVNKISSAFAKGNDWKVRFESVLCGLRTHGHPEAQKLSDYSVKNSPMIDLKRIEDLLSEYGELQTTFDAEHELLQKVFNEASQWEINAKNLLGTESLSLDDALLFAENINADDSRPRGVIVSPARHVLYALTDLLRWHQQLRRWVGVGKYHPRPLEIMVEGVEIIEACSESRRDSGWYQVSAEELIGLILRTSPTSKGKKRLSTSKLQANPLTTLFLDRVLDENLCLLLFFAWELQAKALLDRVETSSKGTCTLESLKAHVDAQPRLQGTRLESLENKEVVCPRKSLIRMVTVFQEKESYVREACAKSKALQKDCIRNPDQARSHLCTLREVHSFLKGEKLAIDEYLEGRLDAEVKLFTWMAKALDFSVLTSEDAPSANDSDIDERLPWDVLIKLKDSQPLVGDEKTGGLACLVTRVNELHQMALAWRNEISAVTQLSLRGGKRRGSPAKEENESDVSEGVDMQKLTELCKRPILRKVAMPRETAVRSMMVHTTQFESKLGQFLGMDYSGVLSDRSPYPRGSSLVEDGGRFILPRLTASPLYRDIKDAILDIDQIASDVFAQTPGIKTFQWIKTAVRWLDELHAGFTISPSGRLVLRLKEAQRLVDLGEAVLLDVPDELKQTLSRHGISISVNKDGKYLTVKSKKKGSQYAIGTTMIRWCPILYNALRSDLTACHMWNERFESFSRAYAAGDVTGLKLENDRAEISDLCHEVSRLVVVPADPVVSQASAILHSLSSFLSKHSSPALKKQAADLKFKNDKNVAPMRAALRDALLDRLASVHGTLATSAMTEEKKSLPFRYAARLVLKNALRTNAAKLDLRVSDNMITSLCEMKAFEIEKEIYERFRGVAADDVINPDYRQQTLTLKRGLSSADNLELCLEILTGKMSPENVACMPSEELASQRLKVERAQAETAAKNAAVLTKPVVKGTDDTSTPDLKTKQTSAAFTNAGKSGDALSLYSSGDKNPVVEQPRRSSIRPARETARAARSSARNAPAPPPPSLANGVRDTWALSSSGSEQFQFSLGNNSRNFCGSLVEETRSDRMDVSLPDRLVEKGRLSVENFVEFVNSKRDRWSLRTYRVIADTETDHLTLSKYSKEYASKRRLSMLPAEDGAKIFVVPPQLTSAVKSVVTLKMENMVYAVLLFRN